MKRNLKIQVINARIAQQTVRNALMQAYARTAIIIITKYLISHLLLIYVCVSILINCLFLNFNLNFFKKIRKLKLYVMFKLK